MRLFHHLSFTRSSSSMFLLFVFLSFSHFFLLLLDSLTKFLLLPSSFLHIIHSLSFVFTFHLPSFLHLPHFFYYFNLHIHSPHFPSLSPLFYSFLTHLFSFTRLLIHLLLSCLILPSLYSPTSTYSSLSIFLISTRKIFTRIRHVCDPICRSKFT